MRRGTAIHRLVGEGKDDALAIVEKTGRVLASLERLELGRAHADASGDSLVLQPSVFSPAVLATRRITSSRSLGSRSVEQGV